jgi:hypothetical protein
METGEPAGGQTAKENAPVAGFVWRISSASITRDRARLSD